MKRKPARKVSNKKTVVSNSSARNNDMPGVGMMSGVFDGMTYGMSPLTMPFGLAADNQYNPLSLNRILLSYAYMTHGVLQTAIDQPVEDAFRGGLDISCDELDVDDIHKLQDYLDKDKVIKAIKDAMRWAKLFGGSGLIINTDQDPKTAFELELVDDNSPLAFIAADRWEILLNFLQSDEVECPYNYYGQAIHKSRVVKIIGKEAPSFIRKRLQGWGMSEVERMIRDINGYVKNQDVIYELLDEAKIDVWRIEGFNTNILSAAAQNKVNARLQVATMLKNYHNAIVMDKEDEYEQKQITFAGLAEMLNQIRVGAAASVRMPMTKLFGLSATGFNSGEDDIENYNALVESEVRAKAREILSVVLPICAKKIFGFVPEHIDFKFKALRILSSESEENIKTAKFNRYDRLYSQGILTAKEYADLLKRDNLVGIETEVGKGIREPEPPESSSSFEKPAKAITEKVPDGV